MSSRTISKLKEDFRLSSPAFRHALRAAVAITAAIAAGKTLALSHGVWIPVSVIVIMRPSLGSTLRISWQRFIGTVMGAVAGILLAWPDLSVAVVFVLVSLGAFFTFYFKAKNFTAFTAFLTLSVVLILGSLFSHTWQGGAERILDTVLGIAFGLGASFLVWPNFARKNLRKEMSGLITSQHTHFRQLRKAYFTHAPKKADLLAGRLEAARCLESCSEKFREACAEPGLSAAQRQELLNLTDLFTRIHTILTALSSIVTKSTGVLHGRPREKFEALMDAVDAQFLSLNTYAQKDIMDTGQEEFPLVFNAFMAYLGQMRQQGEFEAFSLDRRNNSSAFLTQINRLGMELTRAGKRIEALRKAG